MENYSMRRLRPGDHFGDPVRHKSRDQNRVFIILSLDAAAHRFTLLEFRWCENFECRYTGTIYHVLNRGDRRKAIFSDDRDRENTLFRPDLPRT
jgi:hypothetical protein